MGQGHARDHTRQAGKRFFYVVNEVNSKMDAFSYNEGHLTHLQTVPMLPEGYTGIGAAADIHVSSDDRFLYGTTRMDVNEPVLFY